MTFRERLGDFLKRHGVDIEGRLVTFTSQRRGGLNVKQKGDINIVLVSPDAVKDFLESGAGGELISRGLKGLTGLTRIDLADYDAITLNAHNDSSDILIPMSKVVDENDLDALSISMTIKRYEEAGKVQKAMDLRDKLRYKYGIRGNRIQVFYSTGLLREFMDVFLAMVEFTPTYTDRQRAKRVFDRCIEHMDNAVFANKFYTTDRVAEEVRLRFEVDKAKVVLVFGMSERVIKIVEDGIRTFTELDQERQTSRPQIDVRREDYSTKTNEGVIFILTLTEETQ